MRYRMKRQASWHDQPWLLLAAAVLLAAPAAAQPGAGPAGPWSLQRVIDAALASHPLLASAGARNEAARTGVDLARAGYRPYLDAVGRVQQFLAGDYSRVVADDTVAEREADQVYSGSLRLTLPLVREGGVPWVTTLPSEDAARASHDSARYALQITRSEVIGTARIAFFAVLGAEAEVAARQDVAEASRALRDGVRERFAQELVPRADLLRADAALAVAEAELAAARTRRHSALAELAILVGLEPEGTAAQELRVVGGDEALPEVAPLGELLRQAETHPRILAQRARVEQAEAVRRQLATERWPAVDLGARIGGAATSGGHSSRNHSGDNGGEAWDLRVLLQLNWRLFDFGALDLKLKRQAELVQAEQYALAAARRQIALGVSRAYADYSRSLGRVLSAEQAVEAAQELARAARERRAQEMMAQADMLRASADLALARTSLAQAWLAVRTHHAQLRMALGTE